MEIKNITNTSPQSSPIQGAQQDSHEKYLMRQISDTQEQMRAVAQDKELSSEEKMNRRKELQEQLQSLNAELRQYRAQKRQQEAAQKLEVQAQKETGNETDRNTMDQSQAGVIISLSTSEELTEGLTKLKTQLEGKMKTSRNEEEKASLQERVDSITEKINEKMEELNSKAIERQESSKTEKSGKSEEKEKEESEETEKLKKNKIDEKV